MKIDMRKFKKKMNNSNGVVVESGEYEVLIEKVKEGKVNSPKSKFNGSERLGLMLRIRKDVNEKFGNAVIWDNITLDDPKQFYRILQIGESLGFDEEFDTVDLEGKELKVTIKKVPQKVKAINKRTNEETRIDKKDKDGNIIYQNFISKYEESDLVNNLDESDDELENDGLELVDENEVEDVGLDIDDELDSETETETDNEDDFLDTSDEDEDDNVFASGLEDDDDEENDLDSDDDDDDDLMGVLDVS